MYTILNLIKNFLKMSTSFSLIVDKWFEFKVVWKFCKFCVTILLIINAIIFLSLWHYIWSYNWIIEIHFYEIILLFNIYFIKWLFILIYGKPIENWRFYKNDTFSVSNGWKFYIWAEQNFWIIFSTKKSYKHNKYIKKTHLSKIKTIFTFVKFQIIKYIHIYWWYLFFCKLYNPCKTRQIFYIQTTHLCCTDIWMYT